MTNMKNTKSTATGTTTKPRIDAILAILKKRYPEAPCSLDWNGDPWRLLIAARLSAQCTDERVNQVCVPLFEAFPTAESMAAADPADVEAIVRPCGLGHTKALSCVAMSEMLVREYGGRVPDTMDDLLRLPGVGRKIANLILGDVFGKPGIVADTHCIRLNGRFGFYPTTLADPAKVEKILVSIVPPEEQSDYGHRMVLFGREVCTARSPQCADCPLADECAYEGKTIPNEKRNEHE